MNKGTFMKIASKYIFLFYFTVSLISAGLILLLLNILQWPVSAEVIIGITLFVHSIILSRSAKDLFMTALEKGLVSDWVFHLQHGYDMSNSKSETDS